MAVGVLHHTYVSSRLVAVCHLILRHRWWCQPVGSSAIPSLLLDPHHGNSNLLILPHRNPSFNLSRNSKHISSLYLIVTTYKRVQRCTCVAALVEPVVSNFLHVFSLAIRHISKIKSINNVNSPQPNSSDKSPQSSTPSQTTSKLTHWWLLHLNWPQIHVTGRSPKTEFQRIFNI